MKLLRVLDGRGKYEAIYIFWIDDNFIGGFDNYRTASNEKD